MTPRSALSFRRASLSDMFRIAEHVHRAYRGEAARQGWTTESDLLDGQRTDEQELRELIESDASQIWLAERDGELLGTMELKREPGGVVYIGMLAVRPDRQSQGVGRALLALGERLAVELGWGTRLLMTVIAQRVELIAWYERRGYRTTGERRPFPYGDERFGLPRRPDLYFSVLEKQLG